MCASSPTRCWPSGKGVPATPRPSSTISGVPGGAARGHLHVLQRLGVAVDVDQVPVAVRVDEERGPDAAVAGGRGARSRRRRWWSSTSRPNCGDDEVAVGAVVIGEAEAAHAVGRDGDVVADGVGVRVDLGVVPDGRQAGGGARDAGLAELHAWRTRWGRAWSCTAWSSRRTPRSVAQNWARQGEVLTVAASRTSRSRRSGVALALVATRTLEMSAPPVPPGAIDW